MIPTFTSQERREPVKENVAPRAPLDTRWLAGAVALTALALVAATHLDATLPAPLTRRDAPPNSFVAEIAHEHLVNLTSIGPRVAGSYENEVVAVSVLVEAVRGVAAAAAPHHRVELDVHVASGGFALSFLDGMSNVYRDVQSVVARLTSEPPRALVRARSALLLNCHFDTVPDSPGASDDGAGCAVLLEVMRALAASPRPLRHDVVFLFNGAEENIMQASHGFITQHKWARSIRAFINLEACGAGGREVLFQAGPHDPWLVEAYAAAVPHPFASSLAQELFESGLIPADTDFRIFRDFGQLSGLDLAWNANGYVYHTRLDTAARVGLGALQRTGDNVLALVETLLAGEALDSERDAAQRQPVFFDVLGLLVMAARAPAAATLAVATLALVVLKIHLTACDARRHLFVSRGAWWSVVCSAGGCGAVSAAAGAAASVAVALSLHTLDARLAFYSRPALLAPLYALPALAGAWAAARRSWRARRAATVARGWWGARAWHDAAAACWALALAGCTLRGLRSGFLPLMWAALPAAADVAASVLRVAPATRAMVWAAGAALPVLQTCYLALGSLHTFVPLMGRAGDPPLPPDMSMALLVAALTLVASGWLLPLVIVSRRLRVPVRGAAAASALAVALVLVTPLGAPYSEERPQRLMVFHTRRTLHAPLEAGDAPRHETFYWIPQLDANTPRSLLAHSLELRAARPVGDDECARWVYCGAPYYLPVLSLVGASHRAAAASEPLVRLRGGVTASPLNGTARALHVRAEGAAHVVVIVSPAAGARLAWSDAVAVPREGPRWRGRRTYFFMLHAARPPHAWRLTLHVSHGAVHVSLAAHALFGADALHDDQRRLLAALPPWVAATGWGVDLHLYEV